MGQIVWDPSESRAMEGVLCFIFCNSCVMLWRYVCVESPKMFGRKMLEMMLPGRYFTSPQVASSKIMNAVVFRKNGPSSCMNVCQFERPEPIDGQVLVKVYATGINPIDVKLRKHPLSTFIRPLPKIPGTDIAGVVQSSSAGSNFAEGQHVYAMMPMLFWNYGACAEYVSVPETLLSAMPMGLTMTEAAALPLASLTVVEGFDLVLSAMGGEGALRGSRILVTAGSGGVGSVAVQYAKHGKPSYVLSYPVVSALSLPLPLHVACCVCMHVCMYVFMCVCVMCVWMFVCSAGSGCSSLHLQCLQGSRSEGAWGGPGARLQRPKSVGGGSAGLRRGLRHSRYAGVCLAVSVICPCGQLVHINRVFPLLYYLYLCVCACVCLLQRTRTWTAS